MSETDEEGELCPFHTLDKYRTELRTLFKMTLTLQPVVSFTSKNVQSATSETDTLTKNHNTPYEYKLFNFEVELNYM